MLKGIIASTVIATSSAMGCPADCDGDGELSVLDFLCYQELFQSGTEEADMNGDGILNVLDFVAYQAAFQEGCPKVVEVIATGFAYDAKNNVTPATILYLWDDTNADVLKYDDVIMEYRGISVGTGAKLNALINDLPDVEPGETVEMIVLREGEKIAVKPVAFVAEVPANDEEATSKTTTLGDDPGEGPHWCRTVSDTVCRCEPDDADATFCDFTVWRKMDDELGIQVIVRTHCKDTDGDDCDSTPPLEEKGK